MIEEQLIQDLRKGNRKAQKVAYEQLSPVLYGVCLRYLKNDADAEDILVEGMFKIFDKIDKYKGEGSFEGWCRRLMVNECLMFLRKNKNHRYHLEIEHYDKEETTNVIDDLQADDILSLLDQLPQGYRTIFNLYVIEGYKHREIAEMLKISINTSKSQLILAKKKLKGMIGERF